MHSCPAKTEIQSHFLAKPLGIWKFYLISFWSRLIWAQLLSKRFFSILNRNNFKIFCPGGPRLAAPFRLGLLRRQIKTKLTFPPPPIYQLAFHSLHQNNENGSNKWVRAIFWDSGQESTNKKFWWGLIQLFYSINWFILSHYKVIHQQKIHKYQQLFWILNF